jgi:alpha-tubulin suppressor-like RCC1 family protein
MENGGVRCWGSNERGQLGDGTTADRSRPPPSDVLTGAIAVSAGGTHTCALMTGGGVRCWGGNVFGQLGDGTESDRPVPPESDVLVGAKQISTGDLHTCALLEDAGVRCWGHNINGELGIGSYDPVLDPRGRDVQTNAAAVAAGFNFTCALARDGGVRCWGYNGRGQIGDDTDLEVDRLEPADAAVLTGAGAITVGISHTCALMKESRGVRCWGHNGSGQLGNGMPPEPDHSTRPPAADLSGLGQRCP